MIYFIGEMFFLKDEYGYLLADYIASELSMEYEVLLNLDLEKIEKYSIVLSEDKIENIKDCFVLNFKPTKKNMYEIAYEGLDLLEDYNIKDYNELSIIYDEMQTRIDYDMYDKVFKNYLKEGSFLELGAGSGNVTKKLLDCNLDVLASDLNENLLSILSKKLEVATKVIDITNFSLDKKFNYVGMFLDTLNYINPIYLDEVFKNVSKHLEDDGLFIFDIHKQEMLDIFDEYSEQLVFDDLRFHWLSTKIDNIQVEHKFTFINNNLVIEKHNQFILPLTSYQNVYKDYFNELYIKEVDNRLIIVLQKKIKDN